GHERGAFTGAQKARHGIFEMAGRGTIMLDEIGEMSSLLQAKLLHVLQDGAYSRLGGTRTLISEARVIAATNQKLQNLVAGSRFREDLYFRLNVITLEIPPLRERREDIGPLCESFVARYRPKYNNRIKELPPALLSAFERYDWPGNVRELENAVKRYLILPDLRQSLSALEGTRAENRTPSPQVPPATAAGLKELAAAASERTERELIFRTLNEVN